MSIIEQADIFAAAAHQGQVRKYVGEAYIEHPRRVAMAVHNLGLPEHAVAAALLHDTVEDCDVTREDIRAHFGDDVAHLVHLLTDDEPGNRKARKQAQRTRFMLAQGAPSMWAHTIKACDLMDNGPSIREHDPKFWQVFHAEAHALLKVLCMSHPVAHDRVSDMLDVPRVTLRSTCWDV